MLYPPPLRSIITKRNPANGIEVLYKVQFIGWATEKHSQVISIFYTPLRSTITSRKINGSSRPAKVLIYKQHYQWNIMYKVSQVSHVCYIRLLGGKLFRILILHPLPTQPHRIPSVTFRKIIGSSRPNNMHIYKWRWSIVQSFKSIQEASKCWQDFVRQMDGKKVQKRP